MCAESECSALGSLPALRNGVEGRRTRFSETLIIGLSCTPPTAERPNACPSAFLCPWLGAVPVALQKLYSWGQLFREGGGYCLHLNEAPPFTADLACIPLSHSLALRKPLLPAWGLVLNKRHLLFGPCCLLYPVSVSSS